MRTYEATHRQELRGVIKAISSQLTDTKKWNHRHLVLTDNLGICLAISKGRCKDPSAFMLWLGDLLPHCTCARLGKKISVQTGDNLSQAEGILKKVDWARTSDVKFEEKSNIQASSQKKGASANETNSKKIEEIRIKS